jgi:hypothetical protein
LPALGCSEIEPPLSEHVDKHVFYGVLELLVPPDGTLPAVHLFLFAQQTLTLEHFVQLTPILQNKLIMVDIHVKRICTNFEIEDGCVHFAQLSEWGGGAGGITLPRSHYVLDHRNAAQRESLVNAVALGVEADRTQGQVGLQQGVQIKLSRLLIL